MRTALILLALVVVLGFVREAGAEPYATNPNFTIRIGPYSFGFADHWYLTKEKPYNGECSPTLYLGPLGQHKVPFTATQGLVGFCVIVAMLIILPVVLAVRWKRKQPIIDH